MSIIGEGASIVGAYVGPFTSIGDRSVVENSEVENSIILENCTIKDIGSRLGNSLIGRNVKVVKSDRRPVSYKLMVGDNSEIVVL